MIPAIAEAIAANGPLPLARAMALASDHYYATREPFGPAGDFVTAPEISQMFGEIVGVWLADLWTRAGRPDPVILAELGPGRGTLMADALRAIGRAAPGLAAALRLNLVERSERLRAQQRAVLPGAVHHAAVDTLPADAPLLLVGNEFLDALPLTQFERSETGWALRRVGMEGWDRSLPANLAFVPEALRHAAVGSVHERNFAAETLVATVARRLRRQGGAALFVDYGYAGPALGDTLQAIAGGAFADPLRTLGEADLSAHVDFAAMAAVARPHVTVSGPEAQGPFLEALGLSARAARLKEGQPLAVRAEVEAAHARLTAVGAMGRLFQALALTAPGWPAPSGFPTLPA